MTWLVIGIMAAGATATGVLLSRVERVRIRSADGDALRSDVSEVRDPTVSRALRRG